MQKKLWSLMLALTFIFSLTACSMAQTETNAAKNSQSTQDKTSAIGTAETKTANVKSKNAKTLVVYFSWSGNTEKMAKRIAEQTGGDLLRLEPKTPYPTDYHQTGDVAKVERDENRRPAIANLPESIAKYDAIFVGYPIWWHTAPMIIGTFLENYNLSGVDVYPFTQSASMNTQQFKNSMDFVKNSAAGANVHDGLFVIASDTRGIDSYLAKNGWTK